MTAWGRPNRSFPRINGRARMTRGGIDVSGNRSAESRRASATQKVDESLSPGTKMETILALLVGIGLSAASGLRVSVPLLGMSIASLGGYIPLTEGFAWIGTWP